VDDSLLPELRAALDAACAGAAPLRLAIGLPGSFPNRGRPRVVWLGLEGEVQRLVRLAGAIEQTLAPLGFEPEGRPFKAHLTLGRVRQPRKKGPKPDTARLSQDLAGYQGAPRPEFSADRVVLMQSTLTPRGPIYQPLHQVLLAGG
jgi:2'-5' RNA ligase